MSEAVQPTVAATADRAVPRTLPALRLTPSRAWKLTQAAADFVTVLGVAQVCYWLYVALALGKAHYDPGLYLRVDATLASLTMFALHGYGAYQGHLGLLRIESVRRVLRAVFAGSLVGLAAVFFLQIPQFSRLHLLIAFPAVACALIAQRVVLWQIQDGYRRRRAASAPVVVYGAGKTGRLLAQHLLEEHALGLKPVAFLDDRPELLFEDVKAGPGVHGTKLPVLGGQEDIEPALKRTGARAVFLAMPSAPSDRIAQLVAHLERRRIPFFCVPNAGNLVFSTLSFGQIGGVPVFTRRAPNSDLVLQVFKRALDVAGAAALLVSTAPLSLAGALAVRLTSPGPVLFRQTRVGLNGEPFTVLKLRTMRSDAPAYAEHPKDAADPRITAVGRWLRRTCIDELPQLVNVLRGEMSLVGPRPEMPFLVERYSEIERQRLTVKPGVTGLWQISADRAFTIHDNMHYDLYYVEHRGITMDLAVLLMTPFVMMKRDRAV